MTRDFNSLKEERRRANLFRLNFEQQREHLQYLINQGYSIQVKNGDGEWFRPNLIIDHEIRFVRTVQEEI